MADFQRLVNEWTAVKAFWQRNDNVSLSKHCEERGVDYKRCITHNQPMRRLETTEERNKYADDQLAKFRAKLVPRNQQGAAPANARRRPSVATIDSEDGRNDRPQQRENAEELRTLQEQNDRLNSAKNDLQDKVAELTAKVRRLEEAAASNASSSSSFDWEAAYKDLFQEKHNQLNWWRRLATTQTKESRRLRTMLQDNLVDVPASYTDENGDECYWNDNEYPERPLKEGWWEKRKEKLLNPPPAPAPKQGEKMKFKVAEKVYDE